MMLELVSKSDARHQLRLDYTTDSNGEHGPDDPWLEMAIPGVSAAVALWLKDEWRLYVAALDSSGDVVLDSAGDPIPAEDSAGPIVHPSVRLATLLELASQYRFREGEGDNAVPSHEGHGYVLSKGATALLAARRRPTVA